MNSYKENLELACTTILDHYGITLEQVRTTRTAPTEWRRAIYLCTQRMRSFTPQPTNEYIGQFLNKAKTTRYKEPKLTEREKMTEAIVISIPYLEYEIAEKLAPIFMQHNIWPNSIKDHPLAIFETIELFRTETDFPISIIAKFLGIDIDYAFSIISSRINN